MTFFILTDPVLAEQCSIHVERNNRMDEQQARIFCEQFGMINFRSKRLIQFAMGRYCAHQALYKLLNTNLINVKLLQDEKARPVWPQNICGSISHSDYFSASIVGQKCFIKCLGIDIEQIRFESNENEIKESIDELVLTENEKIKFGHFLSPDNHILFFSLKEACYKALNSLNDKLLDFKDVEVVDLDFTTGRGSIKLVDDSIDKFQKHASINFAFAKNVEINHLISVCYQLL